VRCLTCYKEIPYSLDHYFCGYAWYAQYCEDCCPGELDGMECSDIECYEKKTGKKYEDTN